MLDAIVGFFFCCNCSKVCENFSSLLKIHVTSRDERSDRYWEVYQGETLMSNIIPYPLSSVQTHHGVQTAKVTAGFLYFVLGASLRSRNTFFKAMDFLHETRIPFFSLYPVKCNRRALCVIYAVLKGVYIVRCVHCIMWKQIDSFVV